MLGSPGVDASSLLCFAQLLTSPMCLFIVAAMMPDRSIHDVQRWLYGSWMGFPLSGFLHGFQFTSSRMTQKQLYIQCSNIRAMLSHVDIDEVQKRWYIKGEPGWQVRGVISSSLPSVWVPSPIEKPWCEYKGSRPENECDQVRRLDPVKYLLKIC